MGRGPRGGSGGTENPRGVRGEKQVCDPHPEGLPSSPAPQAPQMLLGNDGNEGVPSGGEGGAVLGLTSLPLSSPLPSCHTALNAEPLKFSTSFAAPHTVNFPGIVYLFICGALREGGSS